jgi:type 2A phosphatase activator TIP41
VRYRVMEDCWFVLLRSYVRIDYVCARILDTRIYHEFGTDYLLRDFSYLESSYDELKGKGFTMKLNSSDEVYPHLQTVRQFKDKI